MNIALCKIAKLTFSPPWNLISVDTTTSAALVSGSIICAILFSFAFFSESPLLSKKPWVVFKSRYHGAKSRNRNPKHKTPSPTHGTVTKQFPTTRMLRLALPILGHTILHTAVSFCRYIIQKNTNIRCWFGFIATDLMSIRLIR